MPANPSIAPGTTLRLTAIGTYSNNATKDLTTSVAWTSSNTAVANVSNVAGSQGIVTAGTTTGTATITAGYSGISGSTVLAASSVTAMNISPSSPASMAPGTTRQFNATGTLESTATQDLTTWATWTTLDSAIVTVSNTAGSKGLATAAGPGTTTIEAIYGGITGSAPLTSSPVTSITVSPANASIAKGTAQQFAALGTLADSTIQNLTSWAFWSSSKTAVAFISNAASSKGLATSVDTGATSITAMFDSVTSTAATLTVTPAVLTAITVTPTSKSIALGKTQQFTATGTLSDGLTQDVTSSVTWNSSNPTVATITTAGLAASLKEGTTTITASLSGITSNNAALTITPAQLVSIIVTPLSASIVINTTQAFTATGTFTDGSLQDLTTAVTWNSSDPSVATMSTSPGFEGVAVASPFKAGTTGISATLSPIVSNTAVLTVTSF